MLKDLWLKIRATNREEQGESLRQAAKRLKSTKSTVHYQEQRQKDRVEEMGTNYWETAKGQHDLKRMIISTIYTFGIKGGLGSERISEHFGHLHLGKVAAISASSIQRLTKEIESNILWYKTLVEKDLAKEAAEELKELNAVLGLDETWLDEMLLVCQELTSGYLFLKSRAKEETPRAGGA